MTGYDCSHSCIASIFQTVRLKVVLPLCTAPEGLVPSFSVVMLILPGLLVFSPPCRLNKVIGFLMQFGSRQKQLNFSSLFLSSLFSLPLSFPVLYSQGLVLVLIKAVSFLFFCQHFPQLTLSWEETAMQIEEEWGGYLNEGSAKASVGFFYHSSSQGNM